MRGVGGWKERIPDKVQSSTKASKHLKSLVPELDSDPQSSSGSLCELKITSFVHKRSFSHTLIRLSRGLQGSTITWKHAEQSNLRFRGFRVTGAERACSAERFSLRLAESFIKFAIIMNCECSSQHKP